MKQIIISKILILCLLYCSAQPKAEKIKYIFSDAVEMKIDSVLKGMERNNKGYFFYLVLREDSSIYNITICNYLKKDLKSIPGLIKLTNRYAVVNARMVPLIFDYDFKFSSPSDNLSTFKHRDDQIVRSNLLSECPVVYFNSRGVFFKQE